MEKIDDKSREMLKYLNTNTKISDVTLAEVFNQHYKAELSEALATLSYLANNDLVKMQTNNDRYAVMIRVTHLGRTYEQELGKLEKDTKRKKRADRMWNVVTLIFNAILTIIINLVMKWGFGI